MKLPISSRPASATEVARLWPIVVLAILVVSFPAYTQNSKRSTLPTATNDWLQFRGPNGTGVAEGSTLPAQFGAKQNLAWKAAVPFGRSSPVVTHDRVFLTASEGDKLVTLALDRKTGKLLWRRDVVRARHTPIFKANDAASPTPVSDGKNVIVFFAELGLISYGPDGSERWRLPLGPFNSFYGMGGSPVLAGNTLVLVADQRANSFILAVDARNGKVLWKKDRTNFEGFSTPVVYKPKNAPAQLLVLGSNTLDAYSIDKGERLWWVTRVGAYPKGVPALRGDMVYVNGEGADEPFLPPYEDTLKKHDKDNNQRVQYDEMKAEPEGQEHFGWLDANRDGYIDRAEYDFVRATITASGHGITAIRLSDIGGRGDLTAMNVAWRLSKSYPNIPAPLVYRDVMYLMKEGGIVTSVNPETGEVLKMGRTPEALEEYYASPVAADGKIFMVSASCKVTVLKAGAQWEVLATNDLDEECWATPAIAGNSLIIRTRGALYSFADGLK
ncbi:MAG TPA: PQQ-binding-like beta-propeller repeat protein [Pyrinomonadaceae bacterium]|nr:PQQ-binding-like beta-propeller repeat protein [Pyrinomonadaceae bacterium]